MEGAYQVAQASSSTSTGQDYAVWVLSDLITFKVSGEQTQGAYTIVEIVNLPQTGHPPHLHHQHDEGYYVLEGEYEFVNMSQHQTIKAKVGKFIFLPRGTLHSFTNLGSSKGR